MAALQTSFATLSRRSLLKRSALAGGGLVAGTLLPAHTVAQQAAPAVITSEKMRPSLPYGVQSGDLAGDRAILWARADRPARLMVEWATTESFANASTVAGPAALENSDLTAKLDLAGLPPGQKIHYRMRFVDLADRTLESVPVLGSFWTPPAARQSLRFVWSGDTVGQGWGINLDWGGMKIYEAMRAVEPAFFIHSGDTIYADGPLQAEQALPDGGIWKNVTTPEKSKVAETLAEFRGNFAYNLMDEHLRRFNAAVPMLAQWDDHEVTNNWYPGEDLAGDPTKASYRSPASICLRRAPRERSSTTCRSAPIRSSPGGSMPASATARCSKCSGSTCAPIAAPTPGTTRARPGPTRRSWAISRCAG